MKDAGPPLGEDAAPDELRPLDLKTINKEILAGAKALAKINKQTGDVFAQWVEVIVGLRGLRDLAFAQAHTRNKNSQA